MARLSFFITLLGSFFTLVGIATAQNSVAAPASPYQLRARAVGEYSVEKRGVPAWQFYYDVDSNTHQTNFNKWSQAGYRLISISVYGSPPNARYAAIWVQRTGPGWVAIHNADGPTYQAWFDKWAGQGYVSTLISATGPREGAIYAGVMEEISTSSWFQRCDMAGSDYASYTSTAIGNRQILVSFREYGTPSDRRYCAIYHANPIYDNWDWWFTQSYSDYQQTFNAETTKPYWRPTYVSVSEDHQISSVFTNNFVGPWVARHGMTASDLQSEYETQKANGFYLINLQGGGSGSDAQFTAIFAGQDQPSARQWTVTGTSTGFKNPSSAISEVDGLVQTFMQSCGIRQGQLSIGKNGNVLMERAYTWGEPARYTQQTSTSDTFLLASISKMFCAAAIETLLEQGKIQLSTKAYPLLGYTNPIDPRLSLITVEQLLNHTSGINRTETKYDPTGDARNIALKQNVPVIAVKDMVDYVFKLPLQFDPGTGYAYSNYGYVLLSYVVEHVTGEDYYTYLSKAVLNSGGSYDVRQWLTPASDHTNDPVTQESSPIGPSALQPSSPLLVASIFGGDDVVKETVYGAASLATSASTLVRFINKHAVWGTGGRAAGYDRAGGMDGASTWAQSRPDNVDWSFVVNTWDWPPDQTNAWANFITEQFPAYLDTNPIA